MSDAPEATNITTELEAVGMEEIPAEVLVALVATGREFGITRSVTYSVWYQDVPRADHEPDDSGKTA